MELEHSPEQLTDLSAEESRYVLAAAQRARRMAHDGAPLRDVLSQLTSAVEILAKGRTVASILLLDRDGLLRNGASPNLPADYLDAIDRLKPNAKVGTCAAAAATGMVVETPSFYDDERWSELRHLPLALGFLGAWSMPIKSHEGAVLGTFGTYFREHRTPTARERQSVSLLAGVASEAIALHARVS
jgi:GAF domain-containing protein